MDGGARCGFCILLVVWKQKLDLPAAFLLVYKDGRGRQSLQEDNVSPTLTILLNSLKEMKFILVSFMRNKKEKVRQNKEVKEIRQLINLEQKLNT